MQITEFNKKFNQLVDEYNEIFGVTEEKQMLKITYGISCNLGALAEYLKKSIRDSRSIRHSRLIVKFSHLLKSLLLLAQQYDISLEDILVENVSKLEIRKLSEPTLTTKIETPEEYFGLLLNIQNVYDVPADKQFTVLCLGLTGEVGEIFELILQSVMREFLLVKRDLTLEIGDVIGYLVLLAHEFEITFAQILEVCLKMAEYQDIY